MAKDKRKIKKFTLIKKLIKSVIITVCLFSVSFIMLSISGDYSDKKRKELNKILAEAESVRRETNEIERKSMLTKTYINTWNTTITEKQKEKDGIDIESIKKTITDITSKYVISNLNISFSIPSDVGYEGKKAVSVINSQIDVSFDCLTEYDVYHFLQDLYKNKDAFFIVESLDIRKTKNVTKDFIKNLIANGKNNSLFSSSIRIQWYEFSGK